MMLGRIVRELTYRYPIRRWPWESVEWSVSDALRLDDSEDIEIRGSLYGWNTSKHAVAKVPGRALRAFVYGRDKTALLDAVSEAIAKVAEQLHTRPGYTPPPSGWRKFGRVTG